MISACLQCMKNSDCTAKRALISPAPDEAMGACGKEYCERNFEREMLIDRLEGWM
jgi:hypothetical protein